MDVRSATRFRTRRYLLPGLFCVLAGGSEWVGADAFTVYRGYQVKETVGQIPGDFLRGNLDYEPCSLWGLGYRWHTDAPDTLAAAGRWIGLPNLRAGIELIEVKYSGLQHHYETSIPYVLELAAPDFAGVTLNLATGLGPSFAHGTPSAEGTANEEPDKHYRFLAYLMFETELALADFPALGIVIRIHHRSGAFGLLAPRGVRSNFLTWGLRYRF